MLLWTAAVVFVAIFATCKQNAEKQQEKMIEKALEQGSGEEVKANVDDGKVEIESESGKTTIQLDQKNWPAEAPSEVPKFPYGKQENLIFNEGMGQKTWNVRFSDVKDEALTEYETALKRAGFKSMKIKGPKGGNLTAEKGKLLVTVVVSEGSGFVGITVREKEE